MPGISLNFFFTDSWLPKVVSLFRAEDTAAGVVFLKVPQILLTPATGILWRCSGLPVTGSDCLAKRFFSRFLELLACFEGHLAPFEPLFVGAVR